MQNIIPNNALTYMRLKLDPVAYDLVDKAIQSDPQLVANLVQKANLTINNVLNHKHTEIMGGPAIGQMIVLRLQASL